MEQINELDVKCLGNMPMMLEVISLSLSKLEEQFISLFNDLEKYLRNNINEKKYEIIDNSKGAGFYNVLSYDGNENPFTPELIRYFEIEIKSSFIKRNPFSFNVQFGYWSDKEQNYIYFQISDTTQGIILLTDDLKNEMQANISDFFKCKSLAENDIYIEFDIKSDFSNEKIVECFDLFKKYFLTAILEKMKV